jgi:outer membrane protein
LKTQKKGTTPMNRFRIAAVLVAAAFAHGAAAADFLDTYRLAKQNDSQFASSRAALEAGIEKLPQGRALLLPVINGTANTTWNDATNKTFDISRSFNSNGWSVTLTQPLFRWQNLVQYQQSEFQVLQAEAQFGQATQDLIVRVAQAYFDVLAARDNIDFTVSNKAAIAEQLAQAKRNFEVGTATITDTNEAQARYDLAVAQEIAGVNALLVAQRNLQQIIGQPPDALTPLRTQLVIQPPQPANQDDWAKSARANNFTVRANEAVLEIADREVERQRAGHYPTVDVVASAQENTNASLAVGVPTRSTVSQNAVGLQLNVPFYAGGSVVSRTREATALKEKSRQDLEASRRAAEFNAQQAYLNVTNGLAQVKALEQALVSSETALQSNRVGYEVGVRINIDVLNAQQQVFQTKRDLARSRYDTIINGLKLKAAAGALSEADVEEVNRLLGADQPAPKPSAAPAPSGGIEPAMPPAAENAPAPAKPPAANAEPPKADAAPQKTRSEGKAAKKTEPAKKTATRSSPKSKKGPQAAAAAPVPPAAPQPTATPVDAPAVEKSVTPPVEPLAAPAALQPVALSEPAQPAPVAETSTSTADVKAVASDGTTRVVKFVEPRVPGGKRPAE